MNTKRRALVTGGSGDLGGAICRRLATDGVHVIVHANGNLARAQAVVEDMYNPSRYGRTGTGSIEVRAAK